MLSCRLDSEATARRMREEREHLEAAWQNDMAVCVLLMEQCPCKLVLYSWSCPGCQMLPSMAFRAWTDGGHSQVDLDKSFVMLIGNVWQAVNASSRLSEGSLSHDVSLAYQGELLLRKCGSITLLDMRLHEQQEGRNEQQRAKPSGAFHSVLAQVWREREKIH